MSDHEYKGTKPLRVGDKVDLLSLDETYDTVEVVTALATQFMVNTEHNTLFFFYADKGVTWRKAA